MTITITIDDSRADALRAEAARRNISVEELVRQQADKAIPDNPSAPGSAKLMADLERLWATLPPNFKPPTDEEIKQLKDERRMKKAL